VKVLSEAAYAKWVAEAKTGKVMLTADMLSPGEDPVKVAAAD